MLGQVALANLALIDAGAVNTISSLSDGSTEADIVSALWAPIRDEVLGAHNWDFAKAVVALAEDSGYTIVDEAWEYAYEMPALCIKPRYLSERDYNYEIRDEHILCDVEDAILIYTKRITDTTKWSTYFDTAMAKRLAAALCRPLKRKGSTAKELLSEYMMALATAQMHDATASNLTQDHQYRHTIDNDSWYTARQI